MAPNITVLGSAGSVGVELQDLVQHHDLSDHITFADSISQLSNPAWEEAIKTHFQQSDILVLCLPDEVAKQVVAIKLKAQNGCRILDASSAHRTQPDWVYGLPEIKDQAEQITKAELVSNPGCHATGAILSIKPLIEANLVAPSSPITVQSLTGYSGGGKPLVEKYNTNRQPTALDYSLGTPHKHVPEIKQQTGSQRLSFTPTVLNSFRGMRTLSTIPLSQNLSADELSNIFRQYYQNTSGLIISEPDQTSAPWDQKAETSDLQITVTVQDQIATVLAHYDNLRKGAATALLQNLIIMAQPQFCS